MFALGGADRPIPLRLSHLIEHQGPYRKSTTIFDADTVLKETSHLSPLSQRPRPPGLKAMSTLVQKEFLDRHRGKWDVPHYYCFWLTRSFRFYKRQTGKCRSNVWRLNLISKTRETWCSPVISESCTINSDVFKRVVLNVFTCIKRVDIRGKRLNVCTCSDETGLLEVLFVTREEIDGTDYSCGKRVTETKKSWIC